MEQNTLTPYPSPTPARSAPRRLPDLVYQQCGVELPPSKQQPLFAGDQYPEFFHHVENQKNPLKHDFKVMEELVRGLTRDSISSVEYIDDDAERILDGVIRLTEERYG